MKLQPNTRRELLTALAELSHLRPQWRLGQMMANVAMAAGRMEAGGVWDLEDAEALDATRMLIQQYSTTLSTKEKHERQTTTT